MNAIQLTYLIFVQLGINFLVLIWLFIQEARIKKLEDAHKGEK